MHGWYLCVDISGRKHTLIRIFIHIYRYNENMYIRLYRRSFYSIKCLWKWIENGKIPSQIGTKVAKRDTRCVLNREKNVNKTYLAMCLCILGHIKQHFDLLHSSANRKTLSHKYKLCDHNIFLLFNFISSPLIFGLSCLLLLDVTLAHSLARLAQT